MKRQFVIECDTDYFSCFVYEVNKQQPGDSKVHYLKQVACDPLFSGEPGPKFYGKLHALLFAKDTIAKAPPIEPELPKEPQKKCCPTCGGSHTYNIKAVEPGPICNDRWHFDQWNEFLAGSPPRGSSYTPDSDEENSAKPEVPNAVL